VSAIIATPFRSLALPHRWSISSLAIRRSGNPRPI